ncbi:uncharacterized protein LOC119574897 [Penaeus monodon]|uniref:uncharacterized protein LOC119574897 n=1 Tax=Penaeus monodon TaxID=6687 RepID=UPI0018A7D456|nr:uncharacterized protein LOC119574897 [Penaeus monodon]
MLQQRIIEAGLISHWVDDVVKSRAKRVRMERKLAGKGTGDQADKLLEEGVADTQRDRNVVLGLQHLQGGFLLMFLGYAAALLCLFLEVVTHFLSRLGFMKRAAKLKDHGSKSY